MRWRANTCWARCRAGQGVGHGRFDGDAAVRAPVARDRVLGDHRRDVGGDVLDDPRAWTTARFDRSVTFGTGFERVDFAAVDPGRREQAR